MGIYQGIDVGAGKIRRVTVEGRWNSFKVASNLKPTSKILLIPSNLVTYRKIVFPFQDKRRIMEILPGELMDSLAFQVKDIRWSTSSIEKGAANTFAVPKRLLDEFINLHGNGSTVIDAEPCALARVAAYNKLDNVLIIDFGARKTSVYGVKNGILDLVRVRMIGGNDIDNLIAKEKQVSVETAENVKTEKGLGLKLIKDFTESLIQALSLPQPMDYEQVVITGGGSQMLELREYLQEKLNLPVRNFELPEKLSPVFDAAAFGAALYESAGKDRINLKEQKKTTKNNLLTLAGVLVLVPLFLFSVNLGIQNHQLRKEYREISVAMAEAVRSEFPGIGRITSPLRQVQALVRDGSSGEQDSSGKAMDILADISKAKQGLEIDFYEIELTGGKVKLTGESDSFQSIDNLKKAMSKYFDTADIREQKSKPNGKKGFIIEAERG